MLSSKREESSQLDPSTADFVLFTLSKEATGIWSNHWDSKHVEVHNSRNGDLHVFPGPVIVAQPMLNVLP